MKNGRPPTDANEVGEDDVGPGPLDGDEMLERDRVAVDPAELRGSLHHRVFATHVIRRERQRELGADGRDHIEVRKRGFHHHHVGALGDVEGDLVERLARVGRIHLVAAAIAELRRALRGVAERSVERGGVLRRVREDRDLGMTTAVECGTNRADLTVHHPRRRDHIGPGARLAERDRRVAFERRVVVDGTLGGQQSAVAMISELVEAIVGHEHHRVADLVAQVPQRGLHDAVGSVGTGTARILRGGDAEQHHRRHTEPGELAHLFAQAFLAVLCDARHRHDRLGAVDAVLHEQRCHEPVDGDTGLGHEPPQRWGPTEPPQASLGERHVLRLPALEKLEDGGDQTVDVVRIGLDVDL